jgi:hypothetical protein
VTLWGRNLGGKGQRIGEVSMQRVSDGDAVGCWPKFSLAGRSGDFFSAWEIRVIVGFGESAFHESAGDRQLPT